MTRRSVIRLATGGAALAGAALLGLAAAGLWWRPWATEDPAAADIAAGRQVARTCIVCHALTPDAPPRVGPGLWRIVGRPVGGIAGYGYSDALMRAGGDWTPALLDRFLADPAGTFPGTAMTYGGVADAADRARLIAYLTSLGP